MRPRAAAAAIILAGFAVMLAVNLPGHLEFDSIRQLLEGRKAVYSNWHPPIMSWMLGIADAIAPGAAPFVIFDATLAFGAILSLLWLVPRASWLSVVAAFLLVALPQLFLFQAIVWKDMLFADACVAGFVLVAHAAANWNRPLWRHGLLLCALVLLSLAALTRQSGALVLPCGAVALGAIAANASTWKKGLAYAAVFFLAGAVLVIGANAALQTRASPALGPVEQLEDLQLYDIAGMLKRRPDLKLSVLEQDAPSMAKRMHENGAALYTPIQHDHLTDDPVIHGLIIASVSAVNRQWRELVLAHPGTYLAVRTKDFLWLSSSLHHNACLVYEVGVTGATADLEAAHLSPRYDDRDEWLDDVYGKSLIGTPALSHPAFAISGLISLLVLLRRRRPADLAMAGLLVATFLYALSFFFISIACQYRYLFAIDLAAIAAVFYLAIDLRGPRWAQPGLPDQFPSDPGSARKRRPR